MAEDKKKPAEKKEPVEKKEPAEKKETTAKKGHAAPVDDFAPTASKNKKLPWTIEKCMKAARRFTSEQAWSHGAPSSYKSAVSHGWVAKCLKTMPAPERTAVKRPRSRAA